MSKAAELAALIGSQTALSNRNPIINGAMQVAQRGTSGTSLSGYQAVDRFRTGCGSTNTSISVTQGTDAPIGFKNSLKYEVTSAAGSVANSSTFNYRVEGQDMSHLEWGTANAKTVTLSFYVKCSQAISSLGGSITNSDFSMTYPFDYGISVANTWEKKEITIEGATTGTWLDTNGIGLDINFNLGSASARLATKDVWANTIARGPTGAGDLVTTVNATWQITGVQLEVGEQATPFEHESFAETLQKCQRYYHKLNSANSSGAYYRYMNGRCGNSTSFTGTYHMPVTMRTTPSVGTTGTASNYAINHAQSNTTVTNAPRLGSDGSGSDLVNFDANVASGLTSGQAAQLMSNNNQTSFISFDAEL